MDALQTKEENSDLVKLYVLPQINVNEFHEVTPEQLDGYLVECKQQKRNQGHQKNLYHQLALIGKVDHNTTKSELDNLLRSDVRTLLVQIRRHKPQDIERIFLKINTSVGEFYMEKSSTTPIGIAVEINGELLTTGRMRNNNRHFLEKRHILVLTTNEDYKYCSFKEIVHVSNLWRYLSTMKLGDLVSFNNNEIVGKVVKCGCMNPVTVEVTKAGYLTSYMTVNIPYYIETKELCEKDVFEIEYALRCGAHFLVLSGLRSIAYIQAVKQYVPKSVKLIGSINLEYLESKFIDPTDHLLELDAIWIDDLFCDTPQKIQSPLVTNAISLSKHFEKIIIGTVPLKTCSDFKKLENHKRIKEIDCLLIEKSPLQKKFPLIAKKLLPVDRQQLSQPPLMPMNCKDGIINFVLRTIYSIPCQGIVVSNACPNAAKAFANHRVYCPVIAVVKTDEMARLFNLRRNLKTLVYKESTDPTEYGIALARQQGLFSTGDFIIAIADSMNEDNNICVNLRAYYLPPNA